MWKHLIGCAGTVLWIGITAAYAQEGSVQRYEIGGQITSPYLREFSVVLGRRHELGLGGRFTVNLTKLLSAEAQVDVYPHDKFFDDRRKIQGVFGIRAGVHSGRVGFFGKLRPGFIHLRERLFCWIPEGCTTAAFDYAGRVWFALDAGGVFEVYPSRGLALRIDAGDLFVRRFDFTDGLGNRFYFSSHNFQIGSGVALRF